MLLLCYCVKIDVFYQPPKPTPKWFKMTPNPSVRIAPPPLYTNGTTLLTPKIVHFWGRFWGLIKHTIFDTINSIAISTTRTYFASPRDSVSDAFYVTFARALCFFQKRDTIFIASFFIYNTSSFFHWFPQFQKTHFFIAR